MSDECVHGSLRRSCEICERDDEIARLREELDEIRRITTVTEGESLPAYIRNLERFRDELVITTSNQVCETCGGEGYIDFDTGNPEDCEGVPCPDCGDEARRPTEADIDKAWEQRYHIDGIGDGQPLIRADLLHVVACEKCGGSKIAETPDPGYPHRRYVGPCAVCNRNGKSHGWVWSKK
jgi:hypothetical protein